MVKKHVKRGLIVAGIITAGVVGYKLGFENSEIDLIHRVRDEGATSITLKNVFTGEIACIEMEYIGD